MKRKFHESEVPSMRKMQALIVSLEFGSKSREENLEELRSYGVDTTMFLQEAEAVIKEGLRVQKEILTADAAAAKKVNPLGDLSTMARQAMLDLLKQVQTGVFGSEMQKVASGFYRGGDQTEITDEELRTLLEDIEDLLKR